MNAADALRQGARSLAAAGVSDPVWDAEVLLRNVTGWDRATLLTSAGVPLSAEAEARYLALVSERARRRPLQHLTGLQAFWRHEFRVSPAVLIPRPETELIVEAALALLRDVQSPVIVDVGTGSGCIALSLTSERPDAVVHATDASEAALAVARENARLLGLESRVTFHHGDLLDGVPGLAGRVDLVASNPPYVGASEMESLAPEVRDHEPRLALVAPGGPDSIYRRLVPQARRWLRPGGFLILEIAQGMDAEVTQICTDARLEVIRVIPDLQSIPRTVVARYPATPLPT